MRRRATKPIITFGYNNLTITKQEQEKRSPKFRRLSTNVAPSKISSEAESKKSDSCEIIDLTVDSGDSDIQENGPYFTQENVERYDNHQDKNRRDLTAEEKKDLMKKDVRRWITELQYEVQSRK